MEQANLNLEYEDLFEQLTSFGQLRSAYKAVRRNGGAPGIDDVGVEDFGKDLERNLRALSRELRNWEYKPQPVRRVEIPKPGSKKKRLLGVPCVRDRVVQYAIKQVIEPLFEPHFSENSFGFRPGRSQKDAILQAKAYVESGKEHVVDIDLERFFDCINHDRLLHLIRLRMDDKRVIRLIAMTLRSGVMSKGRLIESKEGTVQGSPLSPLLSNIVLHELDCELEKRELSFCRYADDCNIFVKSSRSGERVLASVSKFIETKLKLKVNKEKSKTDHSSKIKFLGISIVAGLIMIAATTMKRANQTVKELIPRRGHFTVEEQVDIINRWYRGWSNYFAVSETPFQLRNIEARIRVRLRAKIIRAQKRRKHIRDKMIKQGVRFEVAQRTVYEKNRNDGIWKLAHSQAACLAWPTSWFDEKGLIRISQEDRPHWQPLSYYVRLT